MKKMIMALVGMALLTAGPLAAADKHPGMYCEKHCNITSLRKEVKALEKAVEQDKSALQKPRSPDKGSFMDQTNKVKAHLNQHMAELTELQKDVEKLEKELLEMGKE